jgi:cell division inhibitor SepF
MAEGGLNKLWVFLGLKDDGAYDDYSGFDAAETAAEPVAAQPAADATRDAPVARETARRTEAPAVRTIPKTEHPTVVAQRPAVIRNVVNANSRVHIVEPQVFNDAQQVGDRLKTSQPVLLNIQGIDRELQRRLIDFSSGLCYALGGQMSRVADQVFLLTMNGTEISDDEADRLRGLGLYDR